MHLALLPEPEELTVGFTPEQRARVANWDRLMPVRDHVLKSLETARQEKFIGAPLEARVRLTANGDLYPLLDTYASELPGLFIVSQVALEQGTGGELSIKVEKADGAKCERCWKYLAEVGDDPDFPLLCGSCIDVVKSTLAG